LKRNLVNLYLAKEGEEGIRELSVSSVRIKLPWEQKKTKPPLTPSKRATLVLKFSEGRCFNCGKKFDYSNLDVHHIKERSKGGSNKLTNLTILCAGCHRALKMGYIDRDRLKPIKKPKIKRTPRKGKPKRTKTPLERLTKQLKRDFGL